MNTIVLDFLNKERISVLTVPLSDGSLHAATVHYSHTSEPFKIYIQTSGKTLKAQPFQNGQTTQGALVIGFSEEEWVTLQTHGTVRSVIDQTELEKVQALHFQKYPEKKKYLGPDTVFLEFTPTWWRYTDSKKSETIVSE